MDKDAQEIIRLRKLALDPEIQAQAAILYQKFVDQAKIDCPLVDMEIGLQCSGDVMKLALQRACLTLAICEHDKNAAQKPLQQIESMDGVLVSRNKRKIKMSDIHKCEICNKEFVTAMSLHQHNRDKHQPANRAQRRQPKTGYRCDICGQPMTIQSGYAGTGMCGPCATGEADAMNEIGESF